MKNILITYFSESGTTKKVAEIIHNELLNKNKHIDIVKSCNIQSLEKYDSIIIGTPNWKGKPAYEIKKFFTRFCNQLSSKNILFYFTCLSLSEIKGDTFKDISIYKDPQLHCKIKNESEMNNWEKSHTISLYYKNLCYYSGSIKPKHIAFFKGNLIYRKLSFSHALLMRFISIISKEVKQGIFLNEESVKNWTKLII